MKGPETKEEKHKAYLDLDRCHGDFLLAYHDYEHGKNKKIREKGQNEYTSAIAKARRIIDNSPFLVETFLNSDYNQTYVIEEFWQARYFGRDMSGFLQLVKSEIENPSSEL